MNKEEMIKGYQKKLEEASYYYYNTNEKKMSDKEYDDMQEELIKLGGKLIVGAEPSPLKGTINIEHQFNELVGTLDKAKTLEALKEWIEKRVRELGYIPSFLVSLKFDGNSVVIEYKDGKVKLCLTRGKNGKGLDLTHVFHHNIKNKKDIGIKYEVIMRYKDFDQIQKDENETYSNPRSIVAGKLGDDNASKYEKYLTLVPLWVKYKDEEMMERKKQLELIESEFGEETPFFDYLYEFDKEDKWSIDNLMEQFELIYKNIDQKRKDLDYMIDGIVFEIIEQDARKKLGGNEKFPNWAIALKFPPLEAHTKVIGFDYCLGDSKRITPRVWFKKVDFNGTTHHKQSLQNYKRFKELGLGIGSDILVQYRNDCLTYIEKLDTENNKTIKPEPFTDICPICKQHSVKINVNKTYAFCTNPNCSGNNVGKIQNYISKMDIKGIKSSTIKKLKEENLLNSITDLYTMDYRKIRDIKGLGEKIEKNIQAAINSKQSYDYEILGSLRINNVSLVTSKEICSKYKLSDLIKFNRDTLVNNLIENIEGIAEISANYIADGIEENLDTIEFLLKNTKVICYKDKIDKNRKNGEKSLIIVFTGFRDKALQEQLELKGHKATSSVSSKTNLVVTKDVNSSSSKVKKAKSLGIEVINVETFKKRFNLN